MRIAIGLVGVAICFALAGAAQAQRRNFYNRGGVALYNPVVDTVFSGARLVATPTVSRDLKYVTIATTPQISQVIKIETFPFFGIGIVGGANPGAASSLWPANANLSRPTRILPAPPKGLLNQPGMTFVSAP